MFHSHDKGLKDLDKAAEREAVEYRVGDLAAFSGAMYARKDSYYGGVCIWISQFGQSVDLKYAYANAMAKVFRDAGIEAASV